MNQSRSNIRRPGRLPFRTAASLLLACAGTWNVAVSAAPILADPAATSDPAPPAERLDAADLREILGRANPWSGFGGPCETEAADDLAVRFDEEARRFRIHKTVGGRQCLAVSVTEDATGPYDRFEVYDGDLVPTLLLPGCDTSCQRSFTSAINTTRLRASNRWFTLLPAPPANCVGPRGGTSCLSDRTCDTAPGLGDGVCLSTRVNTQPIAYPALAPLVWDTDLAAAAQSRADLCSLQPDPANLINGWGENLAGGTGGTLSLPTAAVASWERQANYYTFGPVLPSPTCSEASPSCPVNQTCNRAAGQCVPDTNEYTQLVWASTERLGCGRAACPASTGPFGAAWDYTVCKFAPPGNLEGERPYALRVVGCVSNAACDDGNPCTTDICVNPGTTSSACAYPPNTLPCDDRNLCSSPDTCSGGRCIPGPNICTGCVDDLGCDDANPCTDDRCVDPGTATATCAYAPNTASCDDGNSCTDPDACAGGRCVPGANTCPGCTFDSDCDDGNPCTDDTCRDPGTASAACVYAANLAPCDDGIFCNGADACAAGICTHAGDPCAGGPECQATCQESTRSCFASATTRCTPDDNSCTFDVCDGAGACGHPIRPLTASCDDGDACTTSDSCAVPGECVGGAPRNCDDANRCTVDSCDPAVGCRNVPLPGPQPTIYFSPSANQFLLGFGARDGDVFRGDTCGTQITRTVAAFPPNAIGLDAVDVRGDGNVVFSVRAAGAIQHPGGQLQAKPENLYLYEPATGAIRVLVDWAALGIRNMPNVNAVDQLRDGTFAFGTPVLRGVTHAGGYLQLRPQSVYLFDPATRRIRLLLDGPAAGLPELDGVDVYPDGRIAFSTKANSTVRRVNVKQQNAYTLENDGTLSLSLDGVRLGLSSLDGFTLEGAID